MRFLAVIVPKMLKLMEENCGTQKGVPQLILLAGASVDDVFVIVLFTYLQELHREQWYL